MNIIEPLQKPNTEEELPGQLDSQFRAIWVDAWGKGILTPEQVTELVDTAEKNHFNAIVAEVRKAGDAYYDSAYEPKAKNIQKGFDPLADLLEKAHSKGIEVHAWLVAYRIWKGDTLPPLKKHVFYTHPEWRTLKNTGEDQNEEGYYLDPGLPEVEDYLTRIYLDVVSKYAVDGLHFDYIRYPGKEWGYNPKAVKRFQSQFKRNDIPDPKDPDWCAWRRKQVSNLVRKVYVEATAQRPKLKVSAATIAWNSFPKEYYLCSSYAEVLQDWDSWMKEEILDFMVPMLYKREFVPEQAKDFRQWLTTFQKKSYSRSIYPGLGAYLNSIPKTLIQARKVMNLGFPGIAFYCYQATNNEEISNKQFFETVGKKLFKSSISLPEMKWKTKPVNGIIRGVITDKVTKQPIDHARIWLAGTSHTVVSDGTGFYAFTRVLPGVYNITVSKTGYAAEAQQGTAVVAGRVTSRDIALSR